MQLLKAKTKLKDSAITGAGLVLAAAVMALTVYAPDLLYVLIPAFAAATTLFMSRLSSMKRKLRELREAIITLDNAVQDDRITEEEFRQTYEDFKKLLSN